MVSAVISARLDSCRWAKCSIRGMPLTVLVQNRHPAIPMTAQASPPVPLGGKNQTACHLVLGDSVKMRALRHVLTMLDYPLSPLDGTSYGDSIIIAFDGCDGSACAAKASFVKAHGENQVLAMIPIGRVPRLRRLLNGHFKPMPFEGTVFDEEVQVADALWSRGLHGLARFIELKLVGSQLKWLTVNPDYVQTFISTLSCLQQYCAMKTEIGIVEEFVATMNEVQRFLVSVSDHHRSGNKTGGIDLLNRWNRATNDGARLNEEPGPLADFAQLVLDVGLADETASVNLATLSIDDLKSWRIQIRSLL